MTKKRSTSIPSSSKSNPGKLNTAGVSHEDAEKIAGGIDLLARPEPFSDSFTTVDACFSVDVKAPWGEATEDIEVKIDCGGMIHGDEDMIDVLIEMLENAKENLAARRGQLTRERLRRLEEP